MFIFTTQCLFCYQTRGKAKLFLIIIFLLSHFAVKEPKYGSPHFLLTGFRIFKAILFLYRSFEIFHLLVEFLLSEPIQLQTILQTAVLHRKILFTQTVLKGLDSSTQKRTILTAINSIDVWWKDTPRNSNHNADFEYRCPKAKPVHCNLFCQCHISHFWSNVRDTWLSFWRKSKGAWLSYRLLQHHSFGPSSSTSWLTKAFTSFFRDIFSGSISFKLKKRSSFLKNYFIVVDSVVLYPSYLIGFFL